MRGLLSLQPHQLQRQLLRRRLPFERRELCGQLRQPLVQTAILGIEQLRNLPQLRHVAHLLKLGLDVRARFHAR